MSHLIMPRADLSFSDHLSRRGILRGLFGTAVGVCCASGTAQVQNSPVLFRIPTREQQLAAIGPLEKLPLVEQRAFAITDAFQTIREPEVGDWLDAHQERRQTFESFQRTPRNIPSSAARTIYVLPLGTFVAGRGPALTDLQEFAAAYFGLPVKVLPGIPLESNADIKRRTRKEGWVQYLSTDILKTMLAHVPKDAFCVVGVTMEDLYPEESWNFVFGQATYADRVGVFSFKRYAPDFNGMEWNDDTRRLMLRRSCHVLVHETGHMFGITHCTWFECIMCGSNHLGESDSRPMHACPVCLRKLHSSAKFDLVARYQKLLAFHQKHGFKDEATWVTKRLQWLGAP
jgi:archaemetzincin